jgi:hypothetical protein
MCSQLEGYASTIDGDNLNHLQEFDSGEHWPLISEVNFYGGEFTMWKPLNMLVKQITVPWSHI